MSGKDNILNPELIKILKIFLISSFALVLVLSFFNTYRANNTDEDKTFKVQDSNRLFFMNVRSIQYVREYRKDAGMTLFRPKGELQEGNLPSLNPAIILNPRKDEAYIYFELSQAEFPVQIEVLTAGDSLIFDFSGGNNKENYALFRKIQPFWENEASFMLRIGKEVFPLWDDPKQIEALKTISEDYLRLLNQTN